MKNNGSFKHIIYGQSLIAEPLSPVLRGSVDAEEAGVAKLLVDLAGGEDLVAVPLLGVRVDHLLHQLLHALLQRNLLTVVKVALQRGLEPQQVLGGAEMSGGNSVQS